ncbi:hypothetical protein MY1884_008339 [Beauveria asiatica]
MAHRGHTPRQDRSARSRQNTPRTPRQSRSKSWDKSLQIAAESGPAAKASLIDSSPSNVRSVKMLDAHNVNIDNCPASERSKPPEDSFGHEQARTATLVAGVAYDARAIAAPNLSRDYVPDMGKEVEMYLDVEYKFEKSPVTEMWPEDIDKVVNEFSRKLQDARAAYSYTPHADAESEDDARGSEFDDLVSEQRRYSILARAQALHGVDFTLRENHRVYGSAGEYMSRNMFNGSMVCTHLKDRSASASSRQKKEYELFKSKLSCNLPMPVLSNN